MNKKIEILSPAGSYESLKAAILSGADAVYVGGNKFGARAYAANFDGQQLLEAIDYVHVHGRRIYLTVNTLLKEAEVEKELYDYLLPLYQQGLDAVIVQDLGVLQFIRDHFPALDIHASTQMTITGMPGASFLEKQGVKRVVLARELNLREIKEIVDSTDIEIECFIHGALCYCYSGQCLYSSLIGGRSGNRGQCAQPCRLPYQIEHSNRFPYLLSLKDICTLELIPDLVESGITSFKIEGRMKKPEYVVAVTEMYRKYTDLYLEKGREEFSVADEDRSTLLDIYNRGGFHKGYYTAKNGREMISLSRPNHAGVRAAKLVKQNKRTLFLEALGNLGKGDVLELNSENHTLGGDKKPGETFTILLKHQEQIDRNAVIHRVRNEQMLQQLKNHLHTKKIKEKMNGKFIISLEKFARLELYYENICIIVEGEKPQKAINQPVTEEMLRKRLQKTGNSEFEFKQLTVEMGEELFIPLQQVGELRREGLAKLRSAICNRYRRSAEVAMVEEEETLQSLSSKERIDYFFVYVEKIEQFYAVCNFPQVKRIYLDCTTISKIWERSRCTEVIQYAHAHEKEIYLAMPYIFRADIRKKFQVDIGFDGVLIRNLESFEYLRQIQYQKPMVLDHNLYRFNHWV